MCFFLIFWEYDVFNININSVKNKIYIKYYSNYIINPFFIKSRFSIRTILTKSKNKFLMKKKN